MITINDVLRSNDLSLPLNIPMSRDVIFKVIGADEFVDSFCSNIVSNRLFHESSGWASIPKQVFEDRDISFQIALLSCNYSEAVDCLNSLSGADYSLIKVFIDALGDNCSEDLAVLFSFIRNHELNFNASYSFRLFLKKLYTFMVINSCVVDLSNENTGNIFVGNSYVGNVKSAYRGLTLHQANESGMVDAKKFFYSLDFKSNIYSDFLAKTIMSDETFYRHLVFFNERTNVEWIIKRAIEMNSDYAFGNIIEVLNSINNERLLLCEENHDIDYYPRVGIRSEVFWSNVRDVYGRYADRRACSAITNLIEEIFDDRSNDFTGKDLNETEDVFEKYCFAALILYFLSNIITRKETQTTSEIEEQVRNTIELVLSCDSNKLKKVRIVEFAESIPVDEYNLVIALNVKIGELM